jgi:RNA polymerase-binding transcription factor
MTAKRSAPKSAKAKKPASRPVARKAETRRPAQRPKATSAPPRKPVPVSPAPKKAANSRSASAAGAAEAKARVIEKATAEKTAEAVAGPARAAPPTSGPQATATRVNHVAAAEGDDYESMEPGSLLAGPRNVQPYIAKRGEQYMSKEQLEHFRQILIGWKRDLMVEVDRTVSHMKDEAANFPDPNDRATQEEEFSLELRTRDRERKLIRKIDEALKRTEDGSYGYCLETGEEIGVKRLEARPVATLTIEAQERRERRERQYGDRDDRYR